jgi:hypothetical protein
MEASTAMLKTSGIEQRALGVGDAVPSIALPNALGQSVDLQDLRERGSIVLIFYHGGWCPYCNLELRAWQQQLSVEYGREGAPDVSRANFETARQDAFPFAVGQNVSHAKFGEGVVLAFEGRGQDARVQVKFRREGTKWLALQYAKLTAV